MLTRQELFDIYNINTCITEIPSSYEESSDITYWVPTVYIKGRNIKIYEKIIYHPGKKALNKKEAMVNAEELANLLITNDLNLVLTSSRTNKDFDEITNTYTVHYETD